MSIFMDGRASQGARQSQGIVDGAVHAPARHGITDAMQLEVSG